MFKEIPKSDVIVRPLKVYKEWTFDENDIQPIFGKEITGTAFDTATDEMSAGQYKRVIYNSIKSQFYTNSATASIITEVGRRKSYASTDERVIDTEIAVLPIPQRNYGEGIKPGSLQLIDGSTTYTDDGYSNLVYNGSIYGNVFYDRGLVVLTQGIVSGSTLSSFSLSYRSTKTIYETEVFIEVLENEFNVSQNPTAYLEDGGKTEKVSVTDPRVKGGNTKYDTYVYKPGIRYIRTKNYPFTSSLNPTKHFSFDDYHISSSVDPTGSYLAPYITTIGLYDDELNMVAVAKLPEPIKSLPDYPLNFIVRLDT